MTTNTDLYATLGLDKTTATTDDIKRAYRNLAVRLHPDKQPTERKSVAEQEFAAINHAYTVLSDPERKRMYDLTGTDDNDMSDNDSGFVDPVFAAMFASMFNSQARNHTVYTQELRVSLSDVLYGNDSKTVKVKMTETCDKCDGTGAASPDDIIPCLNCDGKGAMAQMIGPGIVMQTTCGACMGRGKSIRSHRRCTLCKGSMRVNNTKEYTVPVPRGVKNGHRIVVDAGEERRVVAQVVYDVDGDTCRVEGADVHFRLPPITLKELMCGFVRRIDMYGKKVAFKSSGYFNPTKPKKLIGRGLPTHVGSDKRGDAYIHYNVEFEEYPVASKRHAELEQFFQ